MACPKCGCQMEVAPISATDPQTPPGLCNRCHLGFWPEELSREARGVFRPHHMDFGVGAPARAIREAVAKGRRERAVQPEGV